MVPQHRHWGPLDNRVRRRCFGKEKGGMPHIPLSLSPRPSILLSPVGQFSLRFSK